MAEDSIPVPDPTIRTEERLLREIENSRKMTDLEFDTVRERLDGIDKATRLLNETMTHVPTEVDKQVGHLKELTAKEFESVKTQFRERDTRSERESKDNKVAVDAAFAAQKEAASKEGESNQKAIDKSEKATAETLNKQAQLFETRTAGLLQQIDDLKASIAEVRQLINGASQNKVGGSEALTNQRAVLASFIGIVLFVIVVAGFVVSNKP